MRTHCQSCGDKFTAKEMREFLETAQYADPIFTCTECYETEQGRDTSLEYEQHSDADPGL
ncbi:MAG TPA: hypothetical protein VNX68_12280 [Nitrosopumilaceae archaeon]|jgi:hypothetical protein|nr:hypothetical protein [Nitrosopumilaceae archaeon]